MGFNISNAAVGKGYSRNYKVPAGDYLCQVVAVRQLIGGHKGDRFFLDAKVLEAPAGSGIQKGYEINYSICPADAKTQTDRNKEIGKILRAVAACFGYGAKDAELVDQQVFDKSVVTVTPKEDSEEVSPLAGKLVVVRSVPYTSKNTGTDTTYNEIYPVSLWRGELPEVAQAAPGLPPSAPSKPFPPAGWEQHPDDPKFYFNRAENKVLPEDQLRML